MLNAGARYAFPVARAALLVLLVFLPFQRRIGLPWAEEILLVAALPLAAILRRRRTAFAGERAFAVAVAALGSACLVSGLANEVPLWITALGTFDYLKAFLFFWMAAVLCGDRVWFHRAYGVLRLVAMLAAACTLGEEVVRLVAGAPGMRRFGVYRVSGLMSHPNEMGLYVIAFFLMETARTTRPHAGIALLYGAALCSGSRMVHAAATVLGAFLLCRRRWMWIPVLVSATFLAATFSFTLQEQQQEPQKGGAGAQIKPSFRAYARARALAVWRDHRAVGAGPGRFGGVIALRTDSPLYERDPWEPRRFAFHQRIRSLDQFAPRLLAELGVIGALLFMLVAAATLRAVWLSGAGVSNDRAMFLALWIIPIYCLGSGLNLASVLVTLMVLAGARAGYSDS